MNDNSIQKELLKIQDQIKELPKRYISKKVINGKINIIYNGQRTKRKKTNISMKQL